MSTAARTVEWSGKAVSIGAIERQLAALRQEKAHEGAAPDLRTSVLTHIAWVPPEWHKAAEEVLEGLAERHPSRTIILYPDPKRRTSCLDAEVTLESFALPGLEQQVGAEVIRLSVCGARAGAPASIVLPLLLPDLPVFLRWRGRPDFTSREFTQLVGTADRLVVDAAEWEDPAVAMRELAGFFDTVAVSDLAWSRTVAWRAEIAALWPAVAEVRELAVTGPEAEALQLAGWLRSRLRREVAFRHEPAETVERIALDNREVTAPRQEPLSASDRLSDELEIFGRDRIYEAAVRAAKP